MRVLPYEALRVTTIQQPLKNPHHTNTSPTTTMSLVNTIKHIKPLKSFDDPEFSIWKSQLEDVLKNEGLWAWVDGGVTKPFLSTSLFNGPHDPFLKFRNKQLQASGLIQLSMDPAIGRMFDKAEYEDPTFLWSVLDATHNQALTRGSQAKSLPIRG
jgi:hypothetical protein